MLDPPIIILILIICMQSPEWNIIGTWHCVNFVAELILEIVHVYRRKTGLAIILSSTLLSAVIIVLLIIVIVLIFLRRFQRCRPKLAKPTTTASDSSSMVVSCTNPKVYESEIEYVRANLRKVRNTVSATNPLFSDWFYVYTWTYCRITACL